MTFARTAFALTVVVVVALLGACAHAGGLRCGDGARAMVVDRLYFGTERPGGVVSDAEWKAFVDETIATDFPGGFTTWDASGGWLGADGRALREASHVVEVVHPPGAAVDDAIARAIGDYRERFGQEAVMRVALDACVAF